MTPIIQSQIFSGTPEQVQEQMSAFLKDRVIKIHGFAQSQSGDAGSVVVTATLLYVAYENEQKAAVGFSR
ncbi:MAG: hypothetical protein EOP56_14125 [Sphingobacteriales bacterium]|nr:MAG: hypothetical protein EOP56_14125 [Sphingobacteriales bacterium]